MAASKANTRATSTKAGSFSVYASNNSNATPVVPMMPEAFVLYYCDEIDSKMGAIDRIRSRQKEPGWSDYVNLIGRYLYFDNIPENEEE